MKQRSYGLMVIFSLVAFFQFQFSVASTTESAVKLEVFNRSDNPMAEVQTTLDAARENNKLALIVLGANWCHDSRGLARNFDSVEMQKILSEHYRTVFIDVGNFEDRRDITERFGQVHYFSTPSVYIVDPNSEQLLNVGSLKQWGMADNIPLSEYKSYFTEYATKAKREIEPIGPAYQAQINMFAKFQAHRLNLAYNHLRPKMVEDDSGGSPAGFLEDWKAVREFRIKLQNDLLRLDQLARKRAPLPLQLPSYQPFYWE